MTYQQIIENLKRFPKTHKKLIETLYHYALLLIVAGVCALALYAHPANGEALYASPAPTFSQKPQSTTPDPKVAVKAEIGQSGGSQNEDRVREIAKELGLTKWQEDRAVRIGYCESGLRTNALGDSGRSRGVWQIFAPAHPTITDDQAYDLDWSTRWALQRMKDGYWSLWTCNRLI